jgi:glycosyltransferase involved in cell wall biosynthesis
MAGGTQRHLLEVLKFIDRDRFRPLVVVAKQGGELVCAVKGHDVEVVELGIGESLVSRDFARGVRETARVFRERAVDVVQCFQWRPALIGIGAARLAGRGGIVAGRRSEPVERGLRALADDLIVRLADRVVVNAESLRPRGRAGTRTEVIPSGVDTDHFRAAAGERERAKRALGLSPDVAVVGTVGRLEIRKGTDTLLEAAARLGSHGVARWQLVLVGDGPMRGELEALAARLGIAERTLFVGARTDVREALAALDVFILPSRTEGMSNALLEAMAMACPVVATAVGGTPEVVTEGASGLLVPPEQPDAMAAAVARALQSPELAATLGEGARRRAEERFGSRAMVRRLEEVYASVVPNGNGAAAAGA